MSAAVGGFYESHPARRRLGEDPRPVSNTLTIVHCDGPGGASQASRLRPSISATTVKAARASDPVGSASSRAALSEVADASAPAQTS